MVEICHNLGPSNQDLLVHQQSSEQGPSLVRDTGKHSIPKLPYDVIASILTRAFPALRHSVFTFDALTFATGNINLVYGIYIKTDAPDVPLKAILKVSSSAWGSAKVKNEAAVMNFLRKYFQEYGLCSPSYIPRVYDYSCGAAIQYILTEFIEGVVLGDYYEKMNGTGTAYQDQLAQMWAAMKCFSFEDQKIAFFDELHMVDPSRLRAGATFINDFDAHIPPCSTFKDWVLKTIHSRINQAAYLIPSDPAFYEPVISAIQQLAERFEASSVLDGISWEGNDRLALAHSDLRWHNILVDPETSELKGVIDFEFACLSTFDYERMGISYGEQIPFPETDFKQRLDFHWNEIAKKFPDAGLLDYEPFPSGDQFEKRFFCFRFTCLARYVLRAHEWQPNELDAAKTVILANLETFSAEAEDFLRAQ